MPLMTVRVISTQENEWFGVLGVGIKHFEYDKVSIK